MNTTIDLICKLLKSIGSLGTLATAIAIFYVISLPESVLSRKLNTEASNRERAKIVIDILKVEDKVTRDNLIFAVRDFYPEIDSIFTKIEIDVDIQIKNEYQEKLEDWNKKLQECNNCSESEKKNIELNIQYYKNELEKLSK